jgi:glycosyltransferase involved in cell wall biosynthesis
MEHSARLPLSYILPIAAGRPQARALTGYLRRLARLVDEVIVVDGSPDEVFAAHAAAWGGFARHLRPALRTRNGKVGNVVTGVAAARNEAVVIADDDIRYRRAELALMAAALAEAEVVRPQNRFAPLPWHARWDSGRILLNRLAGGDWPATLGLRRSVFVACGGYRGDVLFENLELVRTIRAAGGRERLALNLVVTRRPPSARYFLSQRIRQAYDEWARPARFAAQLALGPLAVAATLAGGLPALGVLAAAGIGAAEAGRRKGGGRRAFPATSALWAPAWLAERAVTSWIALFSGLALGGAHYRDGRLPTAATPMRDLRRRLSPAGSGSGSA